jgi:hypothetical protein
MRIFLFLFLFALPFNSAFASFGLHLGSHLGFGGMGNESGSRASRTMGTFDLQAMPGYRVFGVMPGLLLEYRMMSQLTNRIEAGSDYSGNGTNFGLGVLFEPGMFKFLASYDFQSRHWFTEPDTTFSGSGYRFLVGYKILPLLAFDFQYVATKYNTVEESEVETSIDHDPVSHWNLGFGVSLSF